MHKIKETKKFSPSTKQTKSIRKELPNSDIFQCCLFLRFTRQHIFLEKFKEMSQTEISKRKEEFFKLSALAITYFESRAIKSAQQVKLNTEHILCYKRFA